MKKIIFWIILLVSLSVVRADESIPLVVWAENGDLVVWQDGTSQIFSVGNLVFPKLSPNGEQVALLRGDYPYTQSLSVISIDGENLRDINVPYPRQIQWQSETILWVNTYLPPSEGALGLSLSTMLYRIDLEADTISQWDMGEPFIMTINPNRTWLALMFAGVYQQTDAKISLLSLAGDEITPQQVMTFPAISGGSHGGYYLPIQWINDDTVRVAIPHPDALYPADEPLKTQLWQFETDMTVTSLGELPNTGIPFSPVWSADGERLAYVTPPESLQQGKFFVMSQDLSQTHFEMPFNFEQFSPIPQTSDFLVIQNNQNLIIFEESDARVWLSVSGFVGDMQIWDGGVVFVSLNEFSNTLVYAGWDDDTLHEIIKISEYPFFDVKWD